MTPRNRVLSVLALMLSLAACDAATTLASSSATDTPDAVAQAQGDKLVVLASAQTQESALRPMMERLHKDEPYQLDSTYVHEWAEGQYSLVGKGTFLDREGQPDQNRCLTVSVDLPLEGDRIVGLLQTDAIDEWTGDSCSGVQCFGCNLIKGAGNYCECHKPAPGPATPYCNHSTSD